MSTRNLPPGYVEIDTWTPNSLSGRDWVALFIAFVILAYASLQLMVLTQLVFAGADSFTIKQDVLITGLVIGTVVGGTLHELAHAVAFLAYGGRPRFGFKPWTKFGPVFWVGAPGCYLSRAKFIGIGACATVTLDRAVVACSAYCACGGPCPRRRVCGLLIGSLRVSGRRCHP